MTDKHLPGLAEVGTPDNTFVYQNFQVHARIVIRNADFVAEYVEALTDDLRAYFAVMPPVFKWRTEPEVVFYKDFETDSYHIKAYARGTFDRRVSLREWHRFDVLRDE